VKSRRLADAQAAQADQARMNALLAMNPAELRALLTGDPTRAARWVESAARRGLPKAQLRLGRMRLDAGQPLEALAWFRRAARQGDAEAMNMVGRALELGWGASPDVREAALWYGRAAQAGDVWGEYNLANLRFDGRGVTRDLPSAAAGYRRAAERGHARAMNLLARCLEEGWGGARDMAQAALWYQRSAEAGYFRGQINHAKVLDEQGRGADAAIWRRKAAEAAQAEAAQGSPEPPPLAAIQVMVSQALRTASSNRTSSVSAVSIVAQPAACHTPMAATIKPA
jgi:TPR repeat protein